jgi:hypothetical protein
MPTTFSTRRISRASIHHPESSSYLLAPIPFHLHILLYKSHAFFNKMYPELCISTVLDEMEDDGTFHADYNFDRIIDFQICHDV